MPSPDRNNKRRLAVVPAVPAVTGIIGKALSEIDIDSPGDQQSKLQQIVDALVKDCRSSLSVDQLDRAITLLAKTGDGSSSTDAEFRRFAPVLESAFRLVAAEKTFFERSGGHV